MNEENEKLISQTEKEIISDKKSKSKKINQVTWIAWWGGTALIVGSWMGIVSNTIGWIGFSLALASSVFSAVAAKYWKFPK